MRITPLRFMALVVGLWTGARVLVLLPGARATNERAPATGRPEPSRHAATATPVRFEPVEKPVSSIVEKRPRTSARPEAPVAPALSIAANGGARAESRPAPMPAPPTDSVAAPAATSPPAMRGPSRLSADAYLFLRAGGTKGLAPGTQLGGGQAFARVTYALTPDRKLAATARLSRPTGGIGAEAALGLRWTPLPDRALSLFAERRVALDKAGRDAWSIFAAGGVDEARVGPLRLDAYAQAGVVGARRRDAFVDGAARLGLPLGRARIGAGIWGAAQPGAARLDLGPQATVRLPGNVTAALDGRIRVAGDARPGSGVALMLATGF